MYNTEIVFKLQLDTWNLHHYPLARGSQESTLRIIGVIILYRREK